MTPIFVAGKNLFLREVMRVFTRLHWFTTGFLLWMARPLWFLYWLPLTMKVSAWNDCHFDVQWNTIASWATIHFGFRVTPNQWKRGRLNSENCLQHTGYSNRRSREMCHTNHDRGCWAVLGLRFNSLCYLTKLLLEILDILSYVFVHVGVWYLTINGVSD